MEAANDKIDTPIFRLIRIAASFPDYATQAIFWLSEEALRYAVSL